MRTGNENRKLPLSECKKILNQEGENLTDEQVLQIRDWLFDFAEMVIEVMEPTEKNKTIN